jgi:hypothetical protein
LRSVLWNAFDEAKFRVHKREFPMQITKFTKLHSCSSKFIFEKSPEIDSDLEASKKSKYLSSFVDSDSLILIQFNPTGS